MAGQASQSESDYGFSLPHLYCVLGLVAGMGIFLLIPSPSQPEVTDRSAAKRESVKAETTLPVAQNVFPEDLGHSAPPVETLLPVIAERRVKPSAISNPPIAAAVAERPPVQAAPIASSADVLPELPEQDLESFLSNRVPTVGLDFDQAKSAIDQIRSSRQTQGTNGPEEFVLALLDETTRNSLPFQDESNCKLAEAKASALGEYSRKLHSQMAGINRTARVDRPSSSFGSQSRFAQRDFALSRAVYEEKDYHKPEAIPALVQILQVDSPEVREQLVELLAHHPTPEASHALVNRAVFDLSPFVREYANKALRHRVPDDFRLELLKALRYPWPPVAWHAAETLVAVKDKEAVPDLIAMLDAPDPTDPFRDASGKMVVRELVRVNHSQNCLLCHAPSQRGEELVAGTVPTPGQPIRPVYYGSQGRSGDVFVRADVTYLRQDFSVRHEAAERQRFDYLVRTREATSKEIAAVEAAADQSLQYPQREAVLYALRKLTGKNGGHPSEDWRALRN